MTTFPVKGAPDGFLSQSSLLRGDATLTDEFPLSSLGGSAPPAVTVVASLRRSSRRNRVLVLKGLYVTTGNYILAAL